MSHYTIPELVRLPESSAQWTVEQLWHRAQSDLETEDVVLEFSRDLIWRLLCPRCGAAEERFAPVGSVRYEEGACPCDGQQRVVETMHSYTGNEVWGCRKLSELGLPLLDIYVARSSSREIGYLPEGDSAAVLGSLAEEGSIKV